MVPALRGSLLTTADLCGMQGGTLCSLGAELEPHVFYSDLSAADSPAFVRGPSFHISTPTPPRAALASFLRETPVPASAWPPLRNEDSAVLWHLASQPVSRVRTALSIGRSGLGSPRSL